MQDAKLNGLLIQASLAFPDVATCPACEGEVRKHRRRSGKTATYFYRHVTGSDGCPRKCRAVGVGVGRAGRVMVTATRLRAVPGNSPLVIRPEVRDSTPIAADPRTDVVFGHDKLRRNDVLFGRHRACDDLYPPSIVTATIVTTRLAANTPIAINRRARPGFPVSRRMTAP